jgi:WD40 repeat protein
MCVDASNAKQTKRLIEITEIKFCPARDVIAVGGKDSFVHLLAIQSNGYRQIGLLKGHTSSIKNIDFSTDGRLLKTTDSSKELLFWDVDSLQRLTNATLYREASWQTNSCIYGWGLQGIFNRYDTDKVLPIDTEINCVCRSLDGNVVIASGSHTVRSAIKLFPYPCMADSVPVCFGGHTSPVLDLQFVKSSHSYKGMNLVSAGGNDSCLFLWDVVSRER